ncbi:hypothetical protein MTR_3g015995 [Medicago truncatula]|uniref:Uncharacterized protein n=1 Tax=Medicago truncatula TaxID=3880 RepID=A0A072UVE0_MEDTR|nr:hypothetical protein MTR_3g015995 [Medicago truncatula]
MNRLAKLKTRKGGLGKNEHPAGLTTRKGSSGKNGALKIYFPGGSKTRKGDPVTSSSPRTACTYHFAYVIGRVPSLIQEQLVPVNMFLFGQVTSSHPRTTCTRLLFNVIGRVTSSNPRTARTCLCVYDFGQVASSSPRTACTRLSVSVRSSG